MTPERQYARGLYTAAVIVTEHRQHITRQGNVLVQLAAEVRREQSPKFLANSEARRGTIAEITGAQPEAVRAWARENGLECGDTGRLPRRVVEAYVAAHTEEGAA